jgi:hypothetical protein
MLSGLMGKIISIAYIDLKRIDLKRCFGENWRRLFFASYLTEQMPPKVEIWKRSALMGEFIQNR